MSENLPQRATPPPGIPRAVESFRRLGDDIRVGEVSVDPERCTGCGLCAQACPAGILEIVEDLARTVQDLPVCIACGDCVAICPEEAVELVGFFELRRRYRYLGRGEPAWPRIF